MCTAISYRTKDHYFGRTLDHELSYCESVTVTPRNYPFSFRMAGELSRHYAMIGMATVAGDYPLYYEATNEKGLSAAGLNFPDNACYYEPVSGRDNVAPFEFIPWLLGKCANIGEVKAALNRINITKLHFSARLPLSPLHWLISDRYRSIVVETLCDGMKIYDDPIGVLTNNPPFDHQLLRLSDFLSLTPNIPENRFSKEFHPVLYSRGMGAFGLPGDLSSPSRFVRAAFVKLNSVSGEKESESVAQFFHILSCVAQPRGCCRLGDGKLELTLYSSCCNTDRGIYYYTTYQNARPTAIDMHREDLDAGELKSFKLRKEQDILWEN